MSCRISWTCIVCMHGWLAVHACGHMHAQPARMKFACMHACSYVHTYIVSVCVYTCVCTYLCTCTHTHMSVCMHVCTCMSFVWNIRSCVRMYVCMYIRTHILTYVPCKVRTNVITYEHMNAHAWICAPTHACMHACMHAYTHTYVRTYARMRVCARVCTRARVCVCMDAWIYWCILVCLADQLITNGFLVFQILLKRWRIPPTASRPVDPGSVRCIQRSLRREIERHPRCGPVCTLAATHACTHTSTNLHTHTCLKKASSYLLTHRPIYLLRKLEGHLAKDSTKQILQFTN